MCAYLCDNLGIYSRYTELGALYPEGIGRGEAYLGKIKVKDSANVFLFQNGGLLICRP